MMLAKYSASGNDFVLFHTFVKKPRHEIARMLCHRQGGVGADGLIVLIPHETHDFEWQFYNADGSDAEMCGNGSRACAHYAASRGLALAEMSFLTTAGAIKAHVDGNMVQSDLTPPIVKEKDLQEGEKTWWLIDTGVPHLITFDGDLETFDIDMARRLRHQYNANVNMATVDPDGSIRVRTYERGVEGETLACGTGMAAAFYRAHMEGRVETHTKVFPKSGETLYLGLVDGTITFKGAVQEIFETSWAGAL